VSVELKSVTPAFNHLCDEDLAFINLAVLSVFGLTKVCLFGYLGHSHFSACVAFYFLLLYLWLM
jgi:hypothetical protein